MSKEQIGFRRQAFSASLRTGRLESWKAGKLYPIRLLSLQASRLPSLLATLVMHEIFEI
jgi:hypothetical protein